MTEPKPAQWSPEHGAAFGEPGVAEAYRHRPPYPAATFALLARLLAPQVPAVVLDAGCGTGFVARPLAPLVARVDAVDIAPSMIAVGQREPGGDHPHIRWLCSPLEQFAGHPPYALIVAGASLHWMDWAVVLPRFAEWLAPGGVLAIVDEVTRPTLWSSQARAVIARHSAIRDFRPYSVRTVAEELERRGLFRLTGSEQVAPAPLTQSIAEYIESFHARSSLARARIGAADQFDAELCAVVAPHCRDGVVRLEVGAEVLWGLPHRRQL
jgi:SAM-dependent methyltransferase